MRRIECREQPPQRAAAWVETAFGGTGPSPRASVELPQGRVVQAAAGPVEFVFALAGLSSFALAQSRTDPVRSIDRSENRRWILGWQASRRHPVSRTKALKIEMCPVQHSSGLARHLTPADAESPVAAAGIGRSCRRGFAAEESMRRGRHSPQRRSNPQHQKNEPRRCAARVS